MKSKHKSAGEKQNYSIGKVVYRPLFPRPVCLEKCTMNIPKGYETDILITLKAFSNQEAYYRKTPHKLQGKDNIVSLDVSSRNDKYRMLFYIDNGICKITHLCTEETHK
jgi:hypothetical protein